MPVVGSKRSNARIDTVPLPENAKWGKLALVRGKYTLTVGGRKIEVPAAVLPAEGELKKLVGKDVVVVFSANGGSSVVAIGTWPTPEEPPAQHVHCYWIICYRPRPELLAELEPRIRTEIINEMTKQGVISRGLSRVIKGAMEQRTR